MKNYILIVLFLFFFSMCTSEKSTKNEKTSLADSNEVVTTKISSLPKIEMYKEINFSEDSLIELIRLDSTFRVDIPYATDSNFTKTTLYPCNKCLIRYKVAKALVNANNLLKDKGLKLKMLDCYRPLSVQHKMWKVYPNPVYVADPNSGEASMHNRGVAVDVTIVDLSGNELDMGTKFDHFGKEAWPSYRNFSDTILKNRDLLSQTMLKVGFRNSRSEWWHYSLKGVNFKVEDFPLPCQ